MASIIGAVAAVLSLVQDRIEADRPDQPPSVTVVVERPDPAEVERIVDERLREIEQQHADHGAHPNDRRGTDR